MLSSVLSRAVTSSMNASSSIWLNVPKKSRLGRPLVRLPLVIGSTASTAKIAEKKAAPPRISNGSGGVAAPRLADGDGEDDEGRAHQDVRLGVGHGGKLQLGELRGAHHVHGVDRIDRGPRRRLFLANLVRHETVPVLTPDRHGTAAGRPAKAPFLPHSLGRRAART